MCIRDRILTIGYQNRYRTDSAYLKRACENDDLGEIYYAKALALRRRAVPTWGVFLNEYEQGGGPLIDIGTHALDLTLWMMDNYKPVSYTHLLFCLPLVSWIKFYRSADCSNSE